MKKSKHNTRKGIMQEKRREVKRKHTVIMRNLGERREKMDGGGGAGRDEEMRGDGEGE